MSDKSKNIDFVIRLFLLGLLYAWCYVLLRPLIAIILWGIILAIASFPLFLGLKARLGGRGKLAATILTLLGIATVIGPVSIIGQVAIDNLELFASNILSGQINVPPPPENLKTWPLIGETIEGIWQSASVNFKSFLTQFQPPLEGLAKNLFGLVAKLALTIVQFIFSIIIAGVLLVNEKGLTGWITKLFLKILPAQGQDFLKLAAATVRNVTRGIIGVAIFQSLVIGIGLIVGQIPYAGILAVICLFLTIIQIGPGLVIIPTILFAWSTMNPIAALLFTIWMIPAMLIDNILKPIFMAQGLPVPMIVILIGVLGGTLVQGLIGLFIGPVILSFGYELLRIWIERDSTSAQMVVEKTTETNKNI